MNTVEEKMYKIRPRYLTKFEDLLRRYCQFGGGADEEKFARGRSFSNVYELYSYAFFIGLYKDVPMGLTSDDELKDFGFGIENWQPKEMNYHMFACAIARSEVDMFEIQNRDKDGIESDIRLLRGTIERYANGGLEYILKKVEELPDQAAQNDFFIKMLRVD